MRILLTSYEYPQFVRYFYDTYPDVLDLTYEDHLRRRCETGYLWSDSYAYYLNQQGHNAIEVVPNNPHLQASWFQEYSGKKPKRSKLVWRKRKRIIPWPELVDDSSWMQEVFLMQLREFKPDVLFVRGVNVISPGLLKECRPLVGLIVGQQASPYDKSADYQHYDLMLSSLPNMVEEFRAMGIPSQFLQLGFDPRLVPENTLDEATYDATFIGKLGGDHASRTDFLASICAKTDIKLWGPTPADCPPTILSHRVGEAWGTQALEVMARSRLTINHHESWAGPHANNLRLFEATGVGCLLITDAKSDLGKLFTPGEEVVTYNDVEECIDKINYYLANPIEADRIAQAGRFRTLNQHTYESIMRELTKIINEIP